MDPNRAVDILLNAYCRGYFPMAEPKTGEILWYRPDPRAILSLENYHCSRSLLRTMRTGKFTVSCDIDFPFIIQACAQREDGTWLSEELIELYTVAHQLGHAHSIEVWHDGEIAGGLYGLSIGSAFFGESMFHRVTDASKVAMHALVNLLSTSANALIEVQFTTPHLERFGVTEISADEYDERLMRALHSPAISFVAGPLELPLSLPNLRGTRSF